MSSITKYYRAFQCHYLNEQALDTRYIDTLLLAPLTFMTGVAGRETVLTVDAEPLLAVTADEAGGMAAALTLLAAPLAPFAAPATQSRRSQSSGLGRQAQESSRREGGATFTFFSFHVLAVAVREVVLDLVLLHRVAVVIVVVVVEPQFLVLVYRPGVSPVSAGGGGSS